MRQFLISLLFIFLFASSVFAANSFDEVSQYETIPDSSFITLPDGDFTISLWINTPDDTGTAFEYILHAGTPSANPSWGLYITEASQGDPVVQDELRFNVRDGDTGFVEAASTNDYFKSGSGHYDVWINIIAIRSGGGSSACTLTLYINGSSVGTATDNTVDASDTSTGLYVAARSDLNSARYFGGKIADLAIWNKALSTGEITELQKYSSNCIPGRKIYIPMIRNYVELANSQTVTNNSSTVTDHPPLIYCN